MLTVRKFRVHSLIKGYLDLFWEIANTAEDVYDYTFTIERSEAPGGPWDQVSQPFTDKYTFRDAMIHPYHRWRPYWYRIKVVNTQTSAEDYSDLATQEPTPSLDAQEMRRAFALMMKEGAGRKCWVFPVRTFGQKCPACWDDLQQKSVVGMCETCFSTGYARGYLEPIAVYGQIDPSGKSIDHAPTIKTQQQNTLARFPYFPPLKPKDMIVEAENRRWRVVTIITKERLRAIVKQEITLHEVPPSDIEFKVPVNVAELENLDVSPMHHFKNPHTLEDANSAIDDLLSIYKV